ncbi:hypothetical protein [Altererythrobacter sp. GH1-8]|uniref:hypothetical protein n=1 Tax=Altererythrobacter sp. GH1-8 TaxID=3349333 RepID=UPI00374CEF82
MSVRDVSLIEELELPHEAGMNSADVLHILTISAATALGEQAIAGRVAGGYGANLILLGRDPSDDLAAMKSVTGVIEGGR